MVSVSVCAKIGGLALALSLSLSLPLLLSFFFKADRASVSRTVGLARVRIGALSLKS